MCGQRTWIWLGLGDGLKSRRRRKNIESKLSTKHQSFFNWLFDCRISNHISQIKATINPSQKIQWKKQKQKEFDKMWTRKDSNWEFVYNQSILNGLLLAHLPLRRKSLSERERETEPLSPIQQYTEISSKVSRHTQNILYWVSERGRERQCTVHVINWINRSLLWVNIYQLVR